MRLGAGAPLRWEVVVSLSCRSTPFLWCLPKETVSSRQRKALFYCGGSTIRVSAPASVVGGHLRPTWGGGGWLSERSSQLDAVGCDVGASSPWERRAGPNSSRGGTQKRVSLGLHPVSLRKSKEMGWNGQDQRGLLHGERRTRKNRRPYRAAVFLFIPGACRRLSTRERWNISTARPG